MADPYEPPDSAPEEDSSYARTTLGGCLVALGVAFVPPALLFALLAGMMLQDFDGTCSVHLAEPEPCGVGQFLANDVAGNPFIFTLWAMGAVPWCLVSGLVLSGAGIWWLARGRR